MINMSEGKIVTAVSDDDDEDDVGPWIRGSARGEKAWEEKRWFGAGEKLNQEDESVVALLKKWKEAPQCTSKPNAMNWPDRDSDSRMEVLME